MTVPCDKFGSSAWSKPMVDLVTVSGAYGAAVSGTYGALITLLRYVSLKVQPLFQSFVARCGLSHET